MPWLLAVLSSAALAEEPPSAPDPASAGGVSTTFTNDLEIRYWMLDQRLPDPSDVAVFNYVEQVERLNARATWGRFALDLQLDQVALFANRYYLDDVLYVERPLTDPNLPNVFPEGVDAYVNPEKIRLSWEGKPGTLQLGDAYVAFGRGVALNLNRNVDIDIDTSVQGAKATLRPGAWDLTFVAGQANRQQVFQDNPNLNLSGDRRHWIAGARFERFGLGPANLGLHGVYYDFVDDPGLAASFDELPTGPDALVGGATVELVGVGGVDWYLEGDLFAYGDDQPSPLGPDVGALGHALYGSAAFYPGPLVVLIEGKRYAQAERVNATLAPELYEVAIAPTLEYERVVTEDSSAALNSNDITGGRVQIDWAAVPGEVVPYVAMAAFHDADTSGLHFNDVPETILHPMVGVEWIDGAFGLLANAGHRWDDRAGTADGADRHLHGDLSLNFPLPGELIGYVGLYGEWFRWGVNALQQEDYVEAETGWTLTWASKVSATAYVDHTSNPLVNTTGNLGEREYLAGELQFKPAPAWTIKGFYGAQKAGIRCSGGQCRLLPGFEGVRFSVVGTL